MRITKLGHCCLLLEIKGKRILTDPGKFSTAQNDVQAIDVVLLTHEHADHLHADSLKQVLKNNPEAKVIANAAVGKILEAEGIAYSLAEKRITIEGIEVESFEAKHEEIYKEKGQVQNTAFLIEREFLYPGDSFFDPGRSVKILALPVAGPWCRMADAVAYALKLAPEKVFPVHDGLIRDEAISVFHYMPELVLTEHGIEFVPMRPGDSKDFG